MQKLMQEIYDAFRAGDRESAIDLTKRLASEYIISLQELQKVFTDVKGYSLQHLLTGIRSCKV